MAENTDTKTGSSAITDDTAVGKGQNISTKSTITGATTGANVVNSPADAKAGEVQGGDIAAKPAENAVPAEKEEKQLFPVKIVKANHSHGGQPLKKGTTIEVDVADYRWFLETSVGEPGNKDDVGLDVTSKGEAIQPETDEEAVARLENEYKAKQQK